MTSPTGSAATERRGESLIRCAIVAPEESEAAGHLARIARENGLRDIEHLVPSDLAMEDPLGFATDDLSLVARLRSTESRGCLVTLWDLDALGVGEEAGEGHLGGEVRELLGQTARWAGQHVAFGSSKGYGRLSFFNFTRAIDANLAFVGTAADCETVLRWWCGTDTSPGLLREAFKKPPSRWLCDVRHDYVARGVLSQLVRESVEELGLVEDQKVVDFWQDALRNVLVHRLRNVASRAMVGASLADEPELVRRIASTPFRLVAPRWVADRLSERGSEAGRDFLSYGSGEEAVSVSKSLASEGVAHALFWEGDDPPMLSGPETAPAAVPTLLVGSEPPRRTWSEWQNLLSRNVLGGFGREELTAQDRGGASILDIKPSRWRPFCFRSLAEALADIRCVMKRSIDELGPAIGPDRTAKLAWSLRGIDAARALYFGPPGTEELET